MTGKQFGLEEETTYLRAAIKSTDLKERRLLSTAENETSHKTASFSVKSILLSFVSYNAEEKMRKCLDESLKMSKTREVRNK